MQKEEYLKELAVLEKKKLNTIEVLKKEIEIWPRSQKVRDLRKELNILKLEKEELLTRYSISNIESSLLRGDNENTVIKTFIERNIISESSSYLEKKTIYKLYLVYCDSIGKRAIKYQTFCKTFPRYFLSRTVTSDRIHNKYAGKKRIYVFTGIALKTN